jgi:hypothetical protein
MMMIMCLMSVGWGSDCTEKGYFCGGTPSTSFQLEMDYSTNGDVVVVDAFGKITSIHGGSNTTNGSSTFYSSNANLFQSSIGGGYGEGPCDCGSRTISWLKLDLPVSSPEGQSFITSLTGTTTWDDGGRCDYIQLG